MAVLLVVATTEATDPTRVSDIFRRTANVTERSSVDACGDTRRVAEEVRPGIIVDNVAPEIANRQPMEPLGSVSLEKEVHI